MTTMIERRELLEEQVVPGKRLGRHLKHDPRSWAYRVKQVATLVSARHSTDTTPILDQGNLGSCTGNAITGALLCKPLASSLTAAQLAALDEAQAVKFYSRATEIDDYSGTYPPTDTGSDGLDVCKAAVEMGYLSGYQHAMGLTDTLSALSESPVIIGIKWRTGMDNPASPSGQVEPTGTVRGGHEVCLDELDVEGQRVWFRNSWGASWGLAGRAWVTWDALGQMLNDSGDSTVPVGLNEPAPTPDPDQVLAAVANTWAAHHKLYPPNETMRQALISWLAAKGM